MTQAVYLQSCSDLCSSVNSLKQIKAAASPAARITLPAQAMASWNTPRVWTAAITLALLPLLPALLVKHYQQDAKFQVTAARLRLEDGRFLAFGTRGTKTNKHKVFYFHGTPASRLEFMSLSGVLADLRGGLCPALSCMPHWRTSHALQSVHVPHQGLGWHLCSFFGSCAA